MSLEEKKREADRDAAALGALLQKPPKKKAKGEGDESQD